MMESNYKTRLVKMLKGIGFWTYVPRDIIHPGVPDVLFLSPAGRFGAVELKRITKKRPKPMVTLKQREYLRNIAKNNGVAIIFVIDERGNSNYNGFINDVNIFNIFVTPKLITSSKIKKMFINQFGV